MVVSEATALSECKIHNVIEYIGLFILMIGLLANMKKSRNTQTTKLLQFILLFIGLGLGILLQNIGMFTKIKVLTPVIIFILIFVYSNGVINNFKTLRDISYSIIAGLFVALLLAIIFGKPLFEYNGLGGALYIGFNGGILYKNYFSSTALAAFIGLYLYVKFKKKSKFDIALLIILTVVIFMASSNGTLLMMIMFLIPINLEYIYRLSTKEKKFFFIVMSFVVIGVFVILYRGIALKNQNYLYRITGLINYLNMFGNDTFHSKH